MYVHLNKIHYKTTAIAKKKKKKPTKTNALSLENIHLKEIHIH